MQAQLAHRGPDGSGLFTDGQVGLASQRLSILDLAGGHQPMTSADGRFTIVFNGEIYNHRDLRGPLEAAGWRFRTSSDTETLLAGFSLRGTDFFRELNGMFVCAVWDSKERSLTLARDPLGIKPLYFCRSGGALYFASELRALLAAGVERRLSPAAVQDYLAYGYVHAPATLIEGIEKFPAGCWMTAKPGGGSITVSYWRLPRENEVRADITEAQAAEELRPLLERAVRSQMLTDVPVGVFLSGGLDSSLVTALMSRAASGQVRSYSVGFDGGGSVDETRYAESVSRFLGTRHETLRLPAGILNNIGDMIACMDEPIADAAILPTWYLARQARKSVKVALTGEGGDEVFAGYGRHKAAYVTEVLESLPGWLQGAAAPLARRMGAGAYFRAVPLKGPADWAAAEAGPRVRAALDVMAPRSSNAGSQDWLRRFEGLKGLNGLLAFDLQTSLADQLLMKVDKTTMGASLEARVPLLDLRLVEFMFRLPAGLKVRLFRGKYLLRKAAAGLLPNEILTRRKHGFVLRCNSWMRSASNEICAEALAGPVLRDTGLFRPEALSKGLKDLRSGSPGSDPGFYFRLVILSLWLRDRKIT
jgi:asparagine synthase (glutamine-hydrolysing)